MSSCCLHRLVSWPIQHSGLLGGSNLAFWPFFDRSALAALAGEVLRPGGFQLFRQPAWTSAAVERVLADPTLPYAALLAAGVVILTCVFLLLIIVTVREAKQETHAARLTLEITQSRSQGAILREAEHQPRPSGLRKASGKEEVLKRAPHRPKPPLPRPLTGAFASGEPVERLIKGQRKDRISEEAGFSSTCR